MNRPPQRDLKADVSSVSPSSKRLLNSLRRRANAQNVSFQIMLLVPRLSWNVFFSISDLARKKKHKFFRVVHSFSCSDFSLTSFSAVTGRGEYIYVDESQSPQVNQSTQLLSPLIRGPKCLRFYYYMNGSDDGNLDVFLWPREQKVNHLMWRGSGEHGAAWIKAFVDVGYTGESQVGRETFVRVI